MNVGIYIYELAEELDWAGPWEVLPRGPTAPTA